MWQWQHIQQADAKSCDHSHRAKFVCQSQVAVCNTQQEGSAVRHGCMKTCIRRNTCIKIQGQPMQIFQHTIICVTGRRQNYQPPTMLIWVSRCLLDHPGTDGCRQGCQDQASSCDFSIHMHHKYTAKELGCHAQHDYRARQTYMTCPRAAFLVVAQVQRFVSQCTVTCAQERHSGCLTRTLCRGKAKLM